MTSTNAYAAYVAAMNNGWELLESFRARVGSALPETIAREDNLTEQEVNALLRTYKRIKPRHRVAASLKLSLDHLRAVSVAIGKVDTRLNNHAKVLDVMLRACHHKTVADAKVRLTEIVSQCQKPDRPSRQNRISLAQDPDENGMIRIQGQLKEHIARELQERSQSFIATAKRKNPHLGYDQLFANWLIRQMRSDGASDVKYQPMIILSGDPNIDFERGHVNTLSGATIPLHEAVNLPLADTGYVAHTSMVNGRAQLNFIAGITRKRFSTGEHRLGVMLETLTCTRCGRPAITCQAHHIDAYAYVKKPEHTWDDFANACAPHNAGNDDNPNAPPKNGRIERDDNGWPGYVPKPGEPMTYNPRRIFYEGWRGTAHDMARNQRA